MKLKAAAAALAVLVAGLSATPVVADEPGTPATGTTGTTAASTVSAKRAWTPEEGGHFNNPIGRKAAQLRIEEQVVQAIKHAKKGSFIRIALFSFDRTRMSKQLIRAHDRGVRVQLLLNDHQRTRAMKRMGKAFGHQRGKNSFMYRCTSGCRSRGENLHSKMYLFSETGGATNVVMTGSANLTTNALVHQWNDLYIRNDDADLYDRFLTVFEQMKKDKPAHPAYLDFKIRDKFELQVLPFPNPRPKNDPIMNQLRKIECKGATGGTGINGRTMVRVDMHRLSGERGKYLGRKLVNLHGQGCNVKLMHGSASPPVREVLVKNTDRGRLRVRANGFDESGDGQIDRYTHHKYLIISGHFGKNTAERRIYTGSSNWAGSGTRGDELILAVRGRGVVRQWTDNFNFIWKNGSRAITYGRAGGRMALPEPTIGGEHWEND